MFEETVSFEDDIIDRLDLQNSVKELDPEIQQILYAKYGVLYNKSKWAQKDKSYQSYSPWSVFGVRVISEISFLCLFIISSYRKGYNVKFVILSMFLQF